MEYVFLISAIALFALAYSNNIKYHKLKNSGKIPYIIKAQRYSTLYLVLGLTSAFAFIFILAV